MKKILLAGLLLYSSLSFAQDQQAITLAATDYVDAFYFGDTLKLKRSVSSAVTKYGYYRAKNQSRYEGEPMTFQEMVDYTLNVEKKNNRAAAEKYIKEVKVLDAESQTACAKVKAWWGTDYLLLAKINDRWVITHILWQSFAEDH